MRRTGILVFIVGVGLACGPALGRSLEVVGKAGYLSEWDLRAVVAQGEGGEHSGPISWKHTGLCTVKGPVEKSGFLRFKISGFGPLSRIDARMSFGDVECSYSGRYADRVDGHLDCTDAKGIPLSLSIRPARSAEDGARIPE